MHTHKFTRWLFAAVAVSLIFTAFAAGSYAQTPKRKPATKATPTPTPLNGDAEIISTAADQNEPTAYIGPPVQKPADTQTDPNAQKIKDLNARIKRLEAAKADPYEEKQKRLLLNLDILTRAEQRSESLRKQLFDMIEKENTVKSRLDQIEYDIRPEMIDRSATFAGSMRPEEVREMKKKTLDSERQNLQSLLNEIQTTRASLAANLAKADALVEKLRAKLETDIDNSFKDDEPDK